MARVVFGNLEELAAKVGQEVVVSDWLEVTQERIDQFADATGDHQWIYVDVERARRESPFKGPIAHGYLTIALAPALLPQLLRVEGVRTLVGWSDQRLITFLDRCGFHPSQRLCLEFAVK